MKLAIPVLVLALGSACAPPGLSVQIEGAGTLDADCKVDKDTALLYGMVNLALTQSYLAAFRVQSHLQLIDTQVGDDVPVTSDRNDFIGTRIRFRYGSSTGTTFVSQPVRDIRMVIAPSSRDNWILFNLLTPEIGSELVAQIAPGGSPIELLATFQIEGHLFSQPAPGPTDPAPMKTNEVTFPIRVVNVLPPGGSTPDPEPICGNRGQDSLGFTSP